MLKHHVKYLLLFGEACDVICTSLFQMGKLRHVESIQLLEFLQYMTQLQVQFRCVAFPKPQIYC